MNDCPFCNIKARVLKENKLACLFLSNPRKVPGHFLVIPKRHVEKPWEINSDEIKDIFELIFLVQKRLTEKLSEGCDVQEHYRPFMKQGRIKINHIHYHVVPRSFNDKIYQDVEKYETEEMFEDLEKEEHDEIATELFED